MRCGEWLRAWPTAGRLASKGIANHVPLRLKLRVRGVFWQPNPCHTLAHAVEFPMRLDPPHQSGVGRPVEARLRELIISRRHSGYLARYELDEARNLVLVARIRHQRESGYSADEL